MFGGRPPAGRVVNVLHRDDFALVLVVVAVAVGACSAVVPTILGVIVRWTTISGVRRSIGWGWPLLSSILRGALILWRAFILSTGISGGRLGCWCWWHRCRRFGDCSRGLGGCSGLLFFRERNAASTINLTS